MRILRNIVLMAAVAVSLALLLPAPALADDATLTCTSGGNVSGGTLFDLSDSPGRRSICHFTGWRHIFSYIICNFVGVLNDILGRVYCGMQYALIGILAATITVYIAIFGLQILMGTTQLNAREILGRLFKIAFIWVFVTNASWGIGITFKFFLLLATEGVTWVMSALPITPDTQALCYENVSSTSGVVRAFAHMDEMICNAVFGPLTTANNEVIGFFLALGLIMPPIFGLAVYWIWMNFMILVRALISFLLGVSALAFMISLSPIFLSLMLFKATYQFFENWLKYMISFSLQIIIIFACISMWITVTLFFVNFFNDLAAVVFPYDKRVVFSQGEQPTDSWGICPYNFSIYGGSPRVTCKNSGFNPMTSDADKYNEIPVSALLMSKHPVTGDPINNTEFLFYVIYHLITLIVVAYAFDALMRDAPSIAVQLSGPQYTPLLGVGMGFNRYGQIMTRHSSADINASKGFVLPEALRGSKSGQGGGIVQNFRDGVGKLLSSQRSR